MWSWFSLVIQMRDNYEHMVILLPFLCFLIFLLQRWQNDKFSNLGIQYHQSDLLSKHLEILARIIKNKLEIRNQQNRARIIRQRVRKGNKKKSRKIKLFIYQSIFRLWKKGFFEYCKKPPKFLWIFWIVNKAGMNQDRKETMK